MFAVFTPARLSLTILLLASSFATGCDQTGSAQFEWGLSEASCERIGVDIVGLSVTTLRGRRVAEVEFECTEGVGETPELDAGIYLFELLLLTEEGLVLGGGNSTVRIWAGETISAGVIPVTPLTGLLSVAWDFPELADCSSLEISDVEVLSTSRRSGATFSTTRRCFDREVVTDLPIGVYDVRILGLFERDDEPEPFVREVLEVSAVEVRAGGTTIVGPVIFGE